jgi:conjugal transfer pilus assembly protein TraW
MILISFIVAKDIKEDWTDGKVYEFAEEDLLTSIQNYINNNRTKIENKLKVYRENVKKKARAYKPDGLLSLKEATEDRVFYPDLTYTLEDNIFDAEGNIMYFKGMKYNPLDYIKYHKTLVVINANIKHQVEWFRKSKYRKNGLVKLLITDGNYYDLTKELKQKVYYCLPNITKKFQLQKTPSIIRQVGNKMQVKELYIKGE